MSEAKRWIDEAIRHDLQPVIEETKHELQRDLAELKAIVQEGRELIDRRLSEPLSDSLTAKVLRQVVDLLYKAADETEIRFSPIFVQLDKLLQWVRRHLQARN